ncbi:substrate-binding domain-containing protein [Mobilicoccus sp.]|uniref:substrate-binding domain-containing protein n=1 Tax=Mobilicoccus sp. TaxID=2034349 RepID=UPI0028AA951F|nr:substrate-binding domain-containing protein [Mobilicoccus sp.]
MTRRHTLSATAALATCLVTLTACSSGGGRPAAEASAAPNAEKPTTMTVAFITHGAPGDTYWDIVKKGAEDAARNDGVELQYSSDPDGAGQANLVKQAVDKKVDGIAVSLAKPEAMSANVKAAVAAGVPVVALNAGDQQWRSLGALAFFGQDEKIAGQEAGGRLKSEGASKVLCVIHEQGNVGHEARCDGVSAGFPGTEKLYVNGADMGDVQSKITAKLQQDTGISHVITLGAPFAMTAISSIQTSGSKTKLVTFDLNKELVDQIKAGKVEWAVDQQPYLQGYLSVESLYLTKTNGNVVGGGRPVLTGPAFVDAANVDKVAEFAAAGKR